MSDDRFEQDEPKDEDVEAHRRSAKGTDEAKTPDDVDAHLLSDDVEAHHHKVKANDEPGSDESDDVEAHSFKRR
jgi:hypothetical protein